MGISLLAMSIEARQLSKPSMSSGIKDLRDGAAWQLRLMFMTGQRRVDVP
jgi:DNA-binding transcriptional regulator GbsR (MarR family)